MELTEQLPPHIDKLFTAEGVPYYVNHKDGTTSWNPPDVEYVVKSEVVRPASEGPPTYTDISNIPSLQAGNANAKSAAAEPYNFVKPAYFGIVSVLGVISVIILLVIFFSGE